MIRVYVSGPVTGRPDGNRAAFDECAARLRALGFDPLVPHEIVPPGCSDWHEAMRHCMLWLPTCDAAVFLPGWRLSRGSRVERKAAMACGLPCIEASKIERKCGL